MSNDKTESPALSSSISVTTINPPIPITGIIGGNAIPQAPYKLTPKMIELQRQSRISYIKLAIVGFISFALVISYIIALFKELASSKDILIVLGSVISFLVGSGLKDGKE